MTTKKTNTINGPHKLAKPKTIAKAKTSIQPHIDKQEKFQSDKYSWCRPDYVPLKLTDPMAQDLIYEYACRRAKVDQAFAEDLKSRLTDLGFDWHTPSHYEKGRQDERHEITSFIDSVAAVLDDPACSLRDVTAQDALIAIMDMVTDEEHLQDEDESAPVENEV